jgi:hypothetical protein
VTRKFPTAENEEPKGAPKDKNLTTNTKADEIRAEEPPAVETEDTAPDLGEGNAQPEPPSNDLNQARIA